jgi:hypothetical protein
MGGQDCNHSVYLRNDIVQDKAVGRAVALSIVALRGFQVLGFLASCTARRGGGCCDTNIADSALSKVIIPFFLVR